MLIVLSTRFSVFSESAAHCLESVTVARTNTVGHWVALALLSRVISQILIKTLALATANETTFFLLVLAAMTGTSLFVRGVAWQKVLAVYPLSVAYSFSALALFGIVGSGALFFGEVIKPVQIVGLVLISIGLLVIGRAGVKE